MSGIFARLIAENPNQGSAVVFEARTFVQSVAQGVLVITAKHFFVLRLFSLRELLLASIIRGEPLVVLRCFCIGIKVFISFLFRFDCEVRAEWLSYAIKINPSSTSVNRFHFVFFIVILLTRRGGSFAGGKGLAL